MEKDISTHVLTYKGKVLIARHQESQGIVSLTVHGYSKDKKSFSKQKDKELKLGINGSHIQVISFECITEYETEIKQPCLLVENHCSTTRQFSLHFLFLVNNSSLVEVANINLQHSVSSLKCKLTDGPNLSWSYRNCVEFICWNSISSSLEHSSHTSTSDELYNSSKLLWSGLLNDTLVAIATVKQGDDDKAEWLIIDFKSELLPSDNALPTVYSSIAICCHVTDVSSLDRDDTVHQIIYIGTSMGQLIGFVRGKLVSHCQLPFDDPCSIVSMETEDSSTYVIVQSQQKGVCAIDCKQSKVVHEWSNKAHVLIDDFLEKGTDQLCLIQGPLKDVFTHFSLTNMNGICIISEQEDLKQSEMQIQDDQTLESLHKTIHALRTRLQASTVSLTEKRMERDEKRELIDATCNMFQRMTLQAPYTTTAPESKIKHSNCVCLIDGHPAAGGQEASCLQLIDVVNPKVLSTWQRVLADKWAIGVELQNNSKSMMTDIALSLVGVNGGNIKSHSQKLFDTNNPRLIDIVPGEHDQGFDSHINSESKSSEAYPKRRKIDDENNSVKKSVLKAGEKICVVTVSELPSFEKGPKYPCSLVLSWTHYHDNEPPCRKVVSCGYVDLSVDQLDELSITSITRPQDVITKKHDVMAVRAVSMETTLLLTSSVSTLFNAVHLIRQGMQLPENVIGDVMSLGSEECLLHACDIHGSLEGVALLIGPGYKQAQVHLFTRCSSQIYIIFHRLCHALPDDVIIDVNHSIEEGAEVKILERVQRDLTDMISKLQIEQSVTNRKPEKEEGLGDSTSDLIDVSDDLIDVSDDKLRKIRVDYEKKRKARF